MEYGGQVFYDPFLTILTKRTELMMTEENKKLSPNHDTFSVVCSFLTPKTLMQLRSANNVLKILVDTLLEKHTNNPEFFFSYTNTLQTDSIRIFFRMLTVHNIKKPDNQWLDHCDDKTLLQYAAMTNDTTNIPQERLDQWLSDHLTDESDKTIEKIKDTPFAYNLLIIALLRQYSSLRDQKKSNESEKALKKSEYYLKKRPSFTGSHQCFLNLAEINLSVTALRQANLNGANLRRAEFHRAEFHRADLIEAKLNGAKLNEAVLSGTKLNEAELRRADLTEADLYMADLSEADLSGAKLNEAELNGADLSGTKLNEADLSGADLNDVCLAHTIFDKTTKFSFYDSKELPHFISKNTTLLTKSLDGLICKTKDHPQLHDIKQRVIQEIITLINKADDASLKKQLYDSAYHHEFITSHSDDLESDRNTNSIRSFFKRKKLNIETEAQKTLREECNFIECSLTPIRNRSTSPSGPGCRIM